MTTPFMKNKEGSMSAPVEHIEMETTEGNDEFGMLDSVVEDMMYAFEKKDKKMLKAALQSLVEHIQEQDVMQDLEQQGE